MNNFSNTIVRYLDTIKDKKKKQDFINQISNLLPQDVMSLEEKIHGHFMQQDMQKNPSFYSDMMGDYKSQQFRMGGRYNDVVYSDGDLRRPVRFADGGQLDDDSASFLDQLYSNRSVEPTTNSSETQMLSQNNNVGREDLALERGVQSAVANGAKTVPNAMSNGLLPDNYPKDLPEVWHVDPKELNKQDDMVAKQVKAQASKISSNEMIQQRLKDNGFNPGKVDGVFGAGTDKAVKSFQAAHGLKVDGIVGKETKKAMGLDIEGTYKSNVQQATSTAKKLGIPVQVKETKEPTNSQYDPTFGGKVSFIDNKDLPKNKLASDRALSSINQYSMYNYSMPQDISESTQDEIKGYAGNITSLVGAPVSIAEVATYAGLKGLGVALPKITPIAKELLNKHGGEVANFAKQLGGDKLAKVQKYGSQFYEEVASLMSKTKESFKSAADKVMTKLGGGAAKIEEKAYNKARAGVERDADVSKYNDFLESQINPKKADDSVLNGVFSDMNDPYKMAQYNAEKARQTKKVADAANTSKKEIDLAKELYERQKQAARRRRSKGEKGGTVVNNKIM